MGEEIRMCDDRMEAFFPVVVMFPKKARGERTGYLVPSFTAVTLLLPFFFWFIPLSGLFSQSLGKPLISGTVVDRDTGAPLDNCYFFLKNYPEFNWLSDEDGKFVLHYPEGLKRDTLMITYMGYQREEMALTFLQGTNLSIELTKSMISLDEVVVVPDRSSLEELLDKQQGLRRFGIAVYDVHQRGQDRLQPDVREVWKAGRPIIIRRK